MSIADCLSLYAIAAIWGLMFLNIFLSIGGFIYMIKVNNQERLNFTRQQGEKEILQNILWSVSWFLPIMKVL